MSLLDAVRDGGRESFNSLPGYHGTMELVYLKSPTGLHHERAAEVLGRIRELIPNLEYREVDPREDPEYAAKFNIKYAPGIIINGRIEYVGIPRERMLLHRIQELQAPQKGAKD